MMDALAKNAPILLVEDDEIDVEAVTRALKKEHISNPLICANDGAEALELLEGTNGREKVTLAHVLAGYCQINETP